MNSTGRISSLLLTATLALSSACSVAAEYRVEKNQVYGMYSGLALTMDVYYPDDPNGYGIVFISGSGWTRELSLDATPLTQTGQEEVYAIPLAEAGYTVFNINHRAAPRFRYPAPVEDAQRAVRFIRHHAGEYAIDPDRIGAMGGSSGAHLSTMLALMDGDGDPKDPSPINRESAKVQAAVVRATPADFRENAGAPLFGFRGNAGRPGTVEARLLAEASPVTYVTADDPPILMTHGDADDVVPIERSEKLLEALQAAGVESELIRVPGGGHGPRFEYTDIVNGERVRRIPDDAPDYISAMLDWFSKHLVEN